MSAFKITDAKGLNYLQQRMGCTSIEDVINRALRLCDRLCRLPSNSTYVHVVHDDGSEVSYQLMMSESGALLPVARKTSTPRDSEAAE